MVRQVIINFFNFPFSIKPLYVFRYLKPNTFKFENLFRRQGQHALLNFKPFLPVCQRISQIFKRVLYKSGCIYQEERASIIPL